MNAPQSAPLFDPGLDPADAGVRFWLAQVTLRLRREIAWCRHQRSGGQAAAGTLPAADDAAQDSLDLLRHRGEKVAFFADDVTARYLTQALQGLQEPDDSNRWSAVAQVLGLDEAAQFVLACALAARADASLGAVAAAALNDASRPYPTPALAQRLWDEPLAIVPCAEPTHMLYRSGLLKAGSGDWAAPLDMPSPVAQALLADVKGRTLPSALRPQAGHGAELPAAARALASWLKATPVAAMQIVPVQTLRGADTAAWVGTLAQAAGSRLAALADDITPEYPGLPGLACAAWLHGADLLAPDHWAQQDDHPEHRANWIAPLAAIAVRWYVPVGELSATRHWSAALVAPGFQVPPLSVAARADRLQSAAGAARGEALDHATEAARRFRLQEKSLARIEQVLRSQQGGWTRDDLLALAYAEAAVDMSQLAQAVVPRFAFEASGGVARKTISAR